MPLYQGNIGALYDKETLYKNDYPLLMSMELFFFVMFQENSLLMLKENRVLMSDFPPFFYDYSYFCIIFLYYYCYKLLVGKESD